MELILQKLQELSDLGYRDFQAKLMPTAAKETIIGVRTPAMRALAKELKGTELAAEFMKELPHQYFDENQLHAFLINELKDYDECLQELERFLPYVDKWATCDQLSPKVLKKQPEATLEAIRKWMASQHVYTIRFGMEMLMSFYLDAWFKPEYLAWVAADRNDEYYVKMMVAWFFATALAKQYEATVPYLEQRLLPEWSHKKAIQKACESYRITKEQKEYLRTLK
ncbi:MAG: DNA alkylation repair protein [Phascolarctobacterium sp.]|nr:DNA alkylation repair protein [Phascolarctobacterium sp.]